MLTGEWHPVFEDRVLETFVDLIPEWLGVLFVPLTHMGSVFFVVPVVVIAYLWDPERFASLIAGVCGYYGLMGGIKSLNSADRPDMYGAASAEWFPGVLSWLHSHGAGITTTSFPSGNAMIATVVVTLLVVDLEISTLRRRAAVGAFVILVVGISRMALAVHYPIDIIGGFALGLALAGAIILIRSQFEVEKAVTAVFVLAFVLAFFGVWVRSGGWGVPTWEGIEGSNRNLALGGSLGGMLVWYVGVRTDWTFSSYIPRPFGHVAVIGLVVALTYVVHVAIFHPLVTMAWAFVVFGSIIVLPHVMPTRTDVESALGIASPPEDAQRSPG